MTDVPIPGPAKPAGFAETPKPPGFGTTALTAGAPGFGMPTATPPARGAFGTPAPIPTPPATGADAPIFGAMLLATPATGAPAFGRPPIPSVLKLST